MSRWKNFTDEETKGLSAKLMDMVQDVRDVCKFPFKFTRTKDSSDIGVKDSAHHSGLAVDIACADSAKRFTMLRAALLSGFRRIGLYNKHVHLDVDDTKPQDVLWIDLSK